MDMTQVECVVFRREGEQLRFLLLKRTEEKGGFWQPVCGKVEPGETLLDACHRELKEEAGIREGDIIRTVEDVHRFRMTRQYLTGKPVEPVEEHAFAFEVANTKIDITMNPDREHEAARWAGYEEALRLLKWEDNREAFRKCRERVK